MTVIPIVVGALEKSAEDCLRDLEIRGISRDHPDYRIIKIGQNTEKSPGDLWRLKNLIVNHRLTLVGKTLEGLNNNNNTSKEVRFRYLYLQCCHSITYSGSIKEATNLQSHKKG